MANPKGNPGNKGGGRKSAYQEQADAKTLAKMYFDAKGADELQKRIESGGKFSIKDRHMLNALEGDQKAITPIFQKLFPDKIESKEDISLKIDV